jgi:hypothetical protein
MGAVLLPDGLMVRGADSALPLHISDAHLLACHRQQSLRIAAAARSSAVTTSASKDDMTTIVATERFTFEMRKCKLGV